MADYWPYEELVINTHPIINWGLTGGVDIVSGFGVKCYGTDRVGKLMVMLASKNAGWGIAMKTVATAGLPVPICLWGLIKLTAGGAGTTRNYQQTFGSAGLLGDATAMTIHSGPVAWGLQSIAAASEGLYFFSP